MNASWSPRRATVTGKGDAQKVVQRLLLTLLYC